MKKYRFYQKMIFSIVIVTIIIGTLFSLRALNANVQMAKINKKEVLADEKKTCSEVLDDNQVQSRYNINVTAKKDGNLEVSINPKKSLRSIEFKIEKINGVELTTKPTVSYGKPASIAKNFVKAVGIDYTGDDTMDIEMKSTKDDMDSYCKGKVEVDITLEIGGGSVETEIVYEEDQELNDLISSGTAKPNCTNPQSDFEKGYCNSNSIFSANQGKMQDKTSDLNGATKFKEDKFFPLKCSPTAISNSSLYNGTTKQEDKYYVNKAYYKATREEEKKFDNYVYHYAPNSKGSEDVTCKIKCTEEVEVKYGPPVATRAGLCFEYNIKITSRVNCNQTKAPKAPKKETKYCTPEPGCIHAGGKIYKQAGPNEDYDSCIQKCDGGKYGIACSKKCYNKVYKTQKAMTSAFYEEADVEQMARSAELKKCLEITKKYPFQTSGYTKYSNKNNQYYGCYYWNKKNDILWAGGNTEDGKGVPGRWYAEFQKGKNYSSYGVLSNGHFRRKSGSGSNVSYCGAKCYWSKSFSTSYCGSGKVKTKYLNPGVAQDDYATNKNTYKKALKACKAAASCQRRTTIVKVSIKENEKTATTDTLMSYSSDRTTSKEEKTKKINDSKYLLDYNGCYQESKSNNSSKTWYMTEFGFGHSWIHGKTGELTYTNPCVSKAGSSSNNTEKCGYVKQKNQYCLPLNQKNVNSKWWNFYYTKAYGNSSSGTSLQSDAFMNNCGKSDACKWQVTESQLSGYSYDWNIIGTARSFGHFEWNFDIKCFYATNDSICDSSGAGKVSNVQCRTDDSKKVRTVDLKNMFPADDGSSKSRNPGFNWTQYATDEKTTSAKSLTTTKTNYNSYPSEYASWVQAKAYSVYHNDYLDYDIVLSKQKINEIKNTNINYGDFSSAARGTTEIGNVTHYKSNLIRNIIGTSNAQFPSESALKCNNMKSYGEDTCETFERKDN